MDEVALARLTSALEAHPRVVFARLFGSHGRGEPGPRFGVDVAVYVREPRPNDDLLFNDLATSALHRDDVDAVILNTAPVALAFEALKGRLFVNKDEGVRVVAEARIMSLYYDRKYHLEHCVPGTSP